MESYCAFTTISFGPFISVLSGVSQASAPAFCFQPVSGVTFGLTIVSFPRVIFAFGFT